MNTATRLHVDLRAQVHDALPMLLDTLAGCGPVDHGCTCGTQDREPDLSNCNSDRGISNSNSNSDSPLLILVTLADATVLRSEFEQTCDRICGWLADHASRRGLTLAAAPRVAFDEAPDNGLPGGKVVAVVFAPVTGATP